MSNGGKPYTVTQDDDSEDKEYVAENEDGAVETHRTKPRQTIRFRILRQFPFLLEIIYWLLIYWVRVWRLEVDMRPTLTMYRYKGRLSESRTPCN